MKKNLKPLSVFLLLLSTQSILAYDISGSKWIGGSTEIYVDLQGSAGTGISWNTAFIAAMNDWTEETRFDFILRQETKNPCLSDGLNSVDFTADVCGSEFGDNTLAVTLSRYQSQILGRAAIVEADIVFNQNRSFNVYDGKLIQFGIQGVDFRRIALHELGHAIGLDHEDSQLSIMASDIGNLDHMTQNDIDGVNALYGGLSNCNTKTLQFGSSSESLNASDCMVNELTVGGDDSSFIDLYQFELTSPTTLQFTMTSSTIDSVLILADEQLRYLAYDDKSGGVCDSTLSHSLPPGNYFLLANTYVIPPKQECSNSGDYVLRASYSSSEQTELGGSASLNGGVSSASFFGGISADNGQTYGNQFAPGESLDIAAMINVDPQHQGRLGFLVIAATVDQQILFLNGNGEFVDSAVSPGVIIRHRHTLLQAQESIIIATDLIPAELGIEEVEVNFYSAYGLETDPDELYFNQLPLNLTISPAAGT